MGVGVVILGVVMAFGATAWQRRHRDSATREVRDRATRRIYEAEEQKQRSEAPARSPR
jgi:hypothetical protein